MSTGIKNALKKCNIYFNECLISKESILEKYLYFFADAMDPQTRKSDLLFTQGQYALMS